MLKFFSTESYGSNSLMFSLEAEAVMAETAMVEADANNDANQTDAELVKVEQGVDAIDTVMDLKDQVDDAVATGNGMDAPTARVVQITMESVRRSLGAGPARFPSMESFASPSTRLNATKSLVIATEGFVDFMKDVWKRIVEFFKGIYRRVNTMVAGLLKSYKLLEKTQEMLMKRAIDRKNWKMDKTKTESSLAKYFGHQGAANLTTMKYVKDALRVFGEVGEQFFELAQKRGVELVAEGGINEKKVIDLAAVLSTELQKAGGLKFANGQEMTFESRPDSSGLFEMTTVAFTDRSDAKDLPKEIELLSPEEILTVLKGVPAEVATGEKHSALAKRVDVIVKELEKAATNIIKHIKEDASKEEKKTIQMGTRFVSGLQTLVSFFSSKIPAMHFSNCKRTLDYCALSLGNLKDPK